MKQETKSESQQPKILYVKSVGSSASEISEISKSLKSFGEKNNIEFIVTNGEIELMSAKELLKELYALVKSAEEK